MIVNILEGKPHRCTAMAKHSRLAARLGSLRGIEQVLLKGIPAKPTNIGGRAECENLALVHSLCAIADAAFAVQPLLKSRFRVRRGTRAHAARA